MFRRINVTGNAGAGKSTLAFEISRALDIPTYGLDSIVWQPGWKETDPVERKHLLQELVSRESWVIDGVSKIIRESADLVIFLDISRRICLYRCTKRSWQYKFKTRPGLPENCPEIMIFPTLIKIVFDFPSKVKPIIMSESTEVTYYRHITSNIQLKSLYAELAI